MNENKPEIKEKETQDEMIKMKVRTFLGLIFSLIAGTNSFSIIYQKIQRNDEKLEYERKRYERKIEQSVEDNRNHLKITNLERDLKECNESKK